MDIIRTIIALLCTFADKYGIDTATLVIICIGGYKLFTNHLAHIMIKMETVEKKITIVNKKLTRTGKTIIEIDKRLTVRERICDERHLKSK